ncbi:MAG TPA: hypothetical protein VKV79_07305 [Terriglobia bacterium]|nr:hypothetical protein [Terriglobia bacterium]
MKSLSFFLFMLVLSGAATAGQQTTNQQRPTLGNSPETNRPTLGEAPSLQGPGSSRIMDPRALGAVRKVYVETMDNFLSAKLIKDFASEGPFRVVTDRGQADAILDGSCFDLPHLKDVHSEVYLTGKNGKAIWQDIIHEPYEPPSLAVAVNKTANLIVTHLRESILKTERR